MNKSMLIGGVFGAAMATAGGGLAGYHMLSAPEYAEVTAAKPLTERVEMPREECHEELVTRQKPVRDQHRITGTVVGAIAGGLIGDALGGGGRNTGAKVAGAAVGGYAGNKAQQSIQQNATETVPQTVCKTVVDVSEYTVGYQVSYRIGEERGTVRMDHDPGARIPLRDGQLVLDAEEAPTG